MSKSEEIKPNNSKKVYLPNGDVVYVTHMGTSPVLARSILRNVLHIPKFIYNLLSVSKATEDLQCCVAFYPDFCLFQDIYSGRVTEIGKEHYGLYMLIPHVNKRNTETTLTIKDTAEPKKEEDIDLWHMRLGHVPSRLLKKLFLIKFDNCDTVVNKRHVYPLPKHTRLQFPNISIKST